MNYKLLPKERPPRYVELPPPPVTKCHAGRDVRNKTLKIILALFFVAALLPAKSFAGDFIKNNEYSKVTHGVTRNEPWTEFCILLYDPTDEDTHMTMGKPYGIPFLPSDIPAGPCIYYYNGSSTVDILCNPVDELVWTSESDIMPSR